jgi:hypothetical protein
VIDDWVEVGFPEAKEHGAARASAEAEGLPREPVPDTDDVAKYVRGRLRDWQGRRSASVPPSLVPNGVARPLLYAASASSFASIRSRR